MTCKFSGWKIGDRGQIIDIGDGICEDCATPATGAHNQYATYMGHREGCDVFKLDHPVRCYGCGNYIDEWLQFCGGLEVTEEIKANRYSFLEK